MINRDGKVFISYAHEDYDSSYNLYKDLKNSGIDVWFDKEDLLPGAKFDFEIRNVIKKSSYFIAMISKNSVNQPGIRSWFAALSRSILIRYIDFWLSLECLADCRSLSGESSSDFGR